MELARTRIPHLFSAASAVVFTAIALLAGRLVAVHLERSTISSTAPELFPVKNQGMAFQRAAVRAKDVLPIYGSSELVLPFPQRASNFFSAAPTGFQVSPVGRPGMGALVILQKVAALGSDLRNKRIAISLSPTFLLAPKVSPRGYEGNFSLMLANEIAFDTALKFKLKQKIAVRMLEYPDTLDQSPLLKFTLKRFASGQWFDRVILCALWPIGKLQTATMELQDHFAALDHIRYEVGSPTLHSAIPDWPKLMAKANRPAAANEHKIENASNRNDHLTPGSRDAAFLVRMNAAAGWADLDLLLCTLASVQATPLLLSMPLDGRFYDRAGVSRAARNVYYNKLGALAQQYKFPIVEFKNHDDDPAFLLRHTDHLTARGWIFYDRAIDDFFHGRIPGSNWRADGL